MSGNSGSGVTPNSSNPFANQGIQQQQLSYQQQQQQALQNSKLQAQLQAALQQNGLSQLGSLTGSDMSPQSLQTLMTNVQNLQELANIQNLQAWQNYRNLQSLQVIPLLLNIAVKRGFNVILCDISDRLLLGMPMDCLHCSDRRLRGAIGHLR